MAGVMKSGEAQMRRMSWVALLAALLVIGSGAFATVPAMAAEVVKIGTTQRTLSGINTTLKSDSLVAYTRKGGASVSTAKAPCAEATVLNGVVTALVDRKSSSKTGSTIPAGGAVLAGSGTVRTWLLAQARVGAAVVLPGSVTAAIPATGPSPTPSPTPSVTSATPTPSATSATPSPKPSVTSATPSPTPSSATPTPTPSVSPSASASASPSATVGAGAVVTVAGASLAITAVDAYRPADSLVVFTRASGAVSPANQWGAEAAVVGGFVTLVRDRQTGDASATPIPSGGVLLSGHGSAREWLLAHAKVGAFVRLPDSLTPAGWPTTPPVTTCPAGTVQLTFDDGPASVSTTVSILDTLKAKGLTSTFFVIGGNVEANPELVRREVAEGHTVANHTWTHADLTALTGQTTTPTNMWGVEVAVSGSVVTAIDDRQTTGDAGVSIPADGYVLSGHGAARDWLLAHVRVGDAVTLPAAARAMTGKDVTLGGSSFTVAGVDGERKADQLLLYTVVSADEQVLAELSRTSDAVAAITGSRPTMWRPPQSRYNSHIVDLASSLGMSMQLFDVDSMDWTSGITAAQVTANVLAGAHDGAVVDLHDTGQNTAEALPGIIDGLRSAGYCLR